jgi:soluble lytic murein transglycosylase
MARSTVLALMLIGLAAGSCSFLDGDPHTTTAALPHVGAPPPEVEDAALQEPPSPTRLAGAAAEARLTADAIEAYLIGRHTGLSSAEIRELAEVVIEEAARYDLEPGLVLAVIQVESACYHRAVSPVGALGLMQILPSTGEELAEKQGIAWVGSETLFDPTINVKLGVAYLKQLSDRYAHVPTALAAYNWGPGRIDRRLQRGDHVPQLYIQQVMRAYDTVGGHLALLTSSS